MISDGYVYIRSKDHPNRTKLGYVLEHRLVMEQSIGRFLEPTEAVHHKDGNTLNNDISNLELCESNGKHSLAHHISRDKSGKFSLLRG